MSDIVVKYDWPEGQKHNTHTKIFFDTPLELSMFIDALDRHNVSYEYTDDPCVILLNCPLPAFSIFAKGVVVMRQLAGKNAGAIFKYAGVDLSNFEKE